MSFAMQRFGATALILAAQADSLAIVRALLEAGSDVFAKDWYWSPDEVRVTALYYAAREGNLAIVQALLEAGSDVRVVDAVKMIFV